MTNRPTELKDTVELMLSDDYKDRFLAEYYQAYIRFKKLYDIVDKYKHGTLDFKPDCPVQLLEQQLLYMTKYMVQLERRAEIEGIELREVEDEQNDNG